MIYFPFGLIAQYAPPAGEEGSTAIYVDSSVFVAWAWRCDVKRGWINISDTTLGEVSYGNNTDALGKADNSVVSLGDAGEAVVYFEYPVTNGPGWDFAVFENAFDDTFLELAFVEVSSDSVNFYRFPSVSLTQTAEQIDTFGDVYAEKIYDLAGKYRVLYGTPFDLEELKNEPGLDVNNIVAIKLIDVVGSISDIYARYDSRMNKINDPWPTPFNTGGFDLDAVGVIHNTINNGVVLTDVKEIKVYPNPCYDVLKISGDIRKITVRDLTGKLLGVSKSSTMDVSNYKVGMMVLEITTKDGERNFFKVIKR